MVRKHQGERIERENLAMARRLLAKQSDFDRHGMEEEYSRHQRYKSLVQKMDPKRMYV